MQQEEVSDLKFISLEELKNLIKFSNELAFADFKYMDKIIEKIEKII